MAGFRNGSYYVTITFLVRSIQIYKVGTLVDENSHQGVTRGKCWEAGAAALSSHSIFSHIKEFNYMYTVQ